MEPKERVLEKKREPLSLSRRRFLSLPTLTGAFLASIGQLENPPPDSICVTESSIKPPTIPLRSEKMGINVARDASINPYDIATLGASWIRFVGMPENVVKPNLINDYLDVCHKAGIKALVLIAKESIGNLSFSEAAKFYSEYAKVDAWQIGNEPDDTVGITSWAMDKKNFTNLLWTFRNVMPNSYLIGGGLDTNQPEYLDGVGYEWVDAIALHPYGQGLPDFPSPYGLPLHIGKMVENYKRFEKPIWITEWGVNHHHFGEAFAAEYVTKMLAYLRDSEDIKGFMYYCWSDVHTSGFGLLREDGSRKKSFQSFSDVAFFNTEKTKFALTQGFQSPFPDGRKILSPR